MIAHVIVDRSSGIDNYYSAEVSRKLGVPNGGWSQEPKRALCLSRAIDAREFKTIFLLGMGEMAELKEITLPDPATPNNGIGHDG